MNYNVIFIVIVLVLVSCMIFYSLWLLLSDCIRKDDNYTYTMSGGYDNKFNNLKVPKRFPQVGVMTNRVLKTHQLKDFVILDKTDGLHVNLAFIGGWMCSIKNGRLSMISEYKDTKFKYTILDGEYYEDNNTYYIFDACRINDIDISKNGFIERMRKACEFLHEYKDVLTNVVAKDFNKVDSLERVIKYVNTVEVNKEGIRIDGVIFQLTKTPYFSDEPTCFKLKRKVMNTVDFRLRLVNNEYYKLYLIGKTDDLVYNRKLLPKEDARENKHEDGDVFEILFSSPYQEGCDKFTPVAEWKDTKEYTKENIKEITTLMKDIYENKGKYDGKIVELSLSKKGWVPMRVRFDKSFPNGYKVGISNCGVMFSPLSTDTVYFQKAGAFDYTVVNPYHEINHIIRKYIIEKSINPLNKLLSVVDLAGGRGGDEENLYRSGAVNIFAVDNDREALVQYVNRTSDVSRPRYKFSFLSEQSKSPDNLPNDITINAIQGCLGTDNKSILKDINSRYERPINGFDVVLMNYAIHYICYDDKCLVALSDLVNDLLKSNGLFIFSRFDGEKILHDMNNGKLKLNTFTLELIDKADGGDGTWCNMALPTIDATGYRPEPLVLDKYIDLLDLETIDEYYPAVDLENEIVKIKHHEKVYDYLRYIKVTVMRKK